MPDGYASSYLPALSRLLGEVEQPTQTQGLMAPQFGGSPEQLMGFMQSPHVQQQLGQYGIHFDPSQLRQSPFFPNQFMQGHPQLGGFLNRAMAGMAATPEAPMVSGFGSGMTRMTQGAMGGPELLRQYQIRQMMAPFQAMGAQIPGMEFQRKQQLLELLSRMEEHRAGQAEKMEMAPRFKPVPGGTEETSYQEGIPAGGPSGLEMVQTGQRPPVTGLGPGTAGQQMPMPGFGLTPEQQAGWVQQFIPETGAQVDLRRAQAGLTGAKTAEQLGETKAGMPTAKVDAEKALAFQRRMKGISDKMRASWETSGHRPEDLAKFSKQYNDFDLKITNQIQALQRAKDLDPQVKMEQIGQLDDLREQAKKTLDFAQRSPGASARPGEVTEKEKQGLQGLITPGAKTKTKTPPPEPGGGAAVGGGPQQTKPSYRVGNQWFDATTHQPIAAPQQ